MKTRHIVATLVSLTLLALTGTSLLASSQPYISGHGINFGVGNKYHVETDLNLSGPGKPLVFKRTYNSQSTETGILGYGWTSTLGEHLLIDTTKIILVQSGGRHVYFIDNGTGAWVNEYGKIRTITAISGGYRLTEPNGSVLLFDSSGNITEKRDINNNSLAYTYSGSQLMNISDSFGRSMSLSYNAGGYLQTLTTPVGTFFYNYDANNNLITLTKPDTTTRQYLYEDANDIHNLTGIIDETGTRIMTVSYDTSDRVISSALAGGSEQMTIEYLPNLQRKITNSLGVVSTYQLTLIKGILRVASFTGPGCSACGASTGSAYTYGSRQLITQKTDANNNITTYTYDADGNRLTKTEAAGTTEERTTSWTYQAGSSRVATITRDSVSNPGQQAVTSLQYDAKGNMTGKTESGFDGATPISRTTTYTYDSPGRITSIDGPRTDVNDITTLAYYPNSADQGYNRANLHTVTNALGHTTTYSNYNAFGKPGTITPPYGSPTTITYDAMGRVATKTKGSIVTTYDYYADGKLHRLHLPDSRTVTYTYTPTGKPATLTDSLGNSITYTYDTTGKRTRQEIHDPNNTLQYYVEYTYEETGDLDKTIQADGTFEDLNYDPVGNLVARINALTKTTEYHYDALNRLTEMIEPGAVTTSYSYDSQDNLRTVTDAENKQTTYTYDDFGRKTSRTSPDTGLTTYQYDSADNMTAQTDANTNTLIYTYDALNRPTTIEKGPIIDPFFLPLLFPGWEQLITSYTYDENGQYGYLTTRTDVSVTNSYESGTTSYNYDALGRMVNETRTQNNLIFTTSYGYNDNSELTSITYPGGRVITYVRDNAGNVISVSSTIGTTTKILANAISYLPFGPATSITLGNGTVITHAYNQLYRLINTTSGSLYNRDYNYNALGGVDAIVDNIDPASSQSFTYDDLNRLTQAQGGYGLYNWTYDKIGNRLSEVSDTDSITYIYSAGTNRLVQTIGSETKNYSYSNTGVMVSRDGVQLNWDERNRLTGTLDFSGFDINNFFNNPFNFNTISSYYGYDDQGRRTYHQANGSVTFFSYDQAGNVLLDTDGQGNIINEYVYLNGAMLALINQSVYYSISDHLGTAQLLVDDQGTIAWKGNYRPFGEVDITVNNQENNFRFPGQYYDSETGLHYNWNRYYDPATGRYITADPIGLSGGMNLYAYVNGNPINGVDPWGLACVLKPLVEVRATGNTDVITKLDSNPIDMIIDSLPNRSSITVYLEHKYEREEWAKFDVLIEVCTDECGNFIRETEISAKKQAGTEYWIRIHEWQRYRTVMFGVPFPVGPFPTPWEEWRQIY